MYTYLINSLFKNKKLEDSLAYTEKLNVAMNEFDGYLRDKFLFIITTRSVINYSVLDKESNQIYWKRPKRNDYIKQLPTYTVFIYLNLCLLLFDTGKIKKAAKHLSRLCLHEDF